ncbi:MAG: tetratricopeptide repeat protein, partial [Planctomycetota bacterium]
MTRTVIGVGVAVLAAGGLIVWGVLADRPEELSASEPAEQAVATLESADAVLEGVQTLIRTGESDRALAVLDAAVRTYPDDRELRLAFAELLVGRGEPGEAYAQYEVAITAGEPEAAVEFKAGGAAGLMGDREKAAAHYAKAAELEPGNADYAETLGLSLIGINDLEAAKVSLLRATAVDPDRGRSWGALAEIALRQNSTGLARQHARRAQQSQPGVAAWRVIEARALKREGSVEDALLLLSRAGSPASGSSPRSRAAG